MVRPAIPWKRKADELRSPPVLVILDMNGVLLVRLTSNKAKAELRPYIEDFLATLFEELSGRVVVAVWSSMMNHNLVPLVHQAFGHYASRLCFVWDQRCCTEKHVPGMHKPLLRKDMVRLQSTPFAAHVQGKILLVDDDAAKCVMNPANTAIHPQSFEGRSANAQDCELLRLSAYIKALVASGCRSVPEFVRAKPLDSFWPEELGEVGQYEEEEDEFSAPAAPAAPPPAKRARLVPAGRAEAPAVAPSAGLAKGAAVEAYWPEDGSWLPATVRQLRNDGQVDVDWVEEDSMSTMPRDHVRLRRFQPQPPQNAPRFQQPQQQQQWERRTTRIGAGNVYYYNKQTGASSPEPPPPWQKRFMPGQPGRCYYFNLVTKAASHVKPEL